MSTKKVRLQDICISISDGDHQAPPKSNLGIPFVTISNITNLNQIDFSDTMFVPRWYYEKIDSKRKAKANDILYSVVGSFGIPVFIKNNKEFIFQRHIAILRPNIKEIVPEYLYYVMLGREFYMIADSVAVGAAQRTITLSSLRNIEIVIPEIVKQQRIVNIISTYDDLIENNQKQIKLLEEAAQRLYKEWFVDLRFPGYENVEIVDGVPEGWQYKKVSSFGSVITGKTPSTAKSQYYGGEVPFIKIPDMHKGIFPLVTEVTLSLEGANSQKNKFIPKNSIMVSCIATVGLVNISIEDCQTNQQINSIVLADERSLYYLYFAMKDLKSLLDGVGSNGATMTNVNKEKFSNLSILCPDTLLLEKYHEYSKPLFDKILNLSKNINYLTEARDRLLPKLMSGEIEV